MKACMVLLLAAAANAQFYSYGVPSVYSTGLYHGISPVSYYSAGISGHKLGKGVFQNHAASSYNYAAKGQYMADSIGAKHYAKREADPYFYSAGYYQPTVYSTGYSTYATPMVYSKPAVYMPTVQKTFANDAAKPFNYAAKGMYHADSIGAKHIAKREAEPYYYSAFPYTSTYATSSLYNSHPLRVNSYIKYFKREAEAEAEPYYYSAYPYTSTYATSSLYNSHPLRVNSYIKYFKREAEAESEPFYNYGGFSGYGTFPTTYTTGFSSFPSTYTNSYYHF